MEPKITLFFADDDQRIRDSSELFWESQDVEAQAFASGGELLVALRAAKELPTAVLADYVMDGGGEELVKTLNREFPELPVIVCTGQDVSGSMRAFNLGAYAIMQKPLDLFEVLDILKELAGRERIFSQMATDVLKILPGFSTSIIWYFDKAKKGYKVAGWSGNLDMAFERQFILKKSQYPRIGILENGAVFVEMDIQSSAVYVDKDVAAERKWRSMVSVPLIHNGRLIGWIDAYHLNTPFGPTNVANWNAQQQFLNIFGRQATEALHSTMLTQQARILHETNQNLAGTLDYKLIFNTILTKAKDFTGADCGWIYEFKPSTQELILGGHFGLEKHLADEKRSLESGGVSGHVAKTGTSLSLANAQEEGEKYGFNPPLDHHILSVLAIPLRRSFRTLGVLKLMSTEADFFTQQDSQFMTSMAAIAALSMERAKLTEHLNRLGKLDQNDSDMKALKKYLVEAVRDLTDADVNLWMPSTREDEGDDFIRIDTSSKSDLDESYQEYIRIAKVPIAPGSSLIAQGLHEKRFIIVPDLDKYDHINNPPFVNMEWAKKFGWHSFMTVPLLGKQGEPLGAISIFSQKINRFTNDDGQLIQHFANQAAAALERQKSLKTLEDLAKVAQELTLGNPSAQALSKKTAALAKTFTNADLAVIYPFDVDDDQYYDRALYAYAGTLRSATKELTDRPRTNGMAAFVRQHRMLIIEDILPGQTAIKAQKGRQAESLIPGSPEYNNVLGFVQGSKIIQRENIRAFVGVALTAVESGKQKSTSHNQDVAVLYVNFRSPRHFTEEDLQVLDIFSHQVANIIHRNRLFEATSKQQKLLESLSRSTLHIMQSQDSQQGLDSIVSEAVSLLRTKGGKMYLTENGSRQDLRLVAMKGINIPELQIGTLMSSDQGMAGRVVRTKKPLMTAYYPGHTDSIPSLHPYFSAVLEVPMLIGNEVIGALSVFDDRSNKVFRKNDQELLQKLADQAALAIFRSRLNDEAVALYQTSKQISEQANPKELAHTILTELRKIIGFDRACFQVFTDENAQRRVLAMEGETLSLPADGLHRPIAQDELLKPILHDKKPIILSDTRKSSHWDTTVTATRNIRSWVCVPLVFQGKVLGIITLDHFISGYYQPQDSQKLVRFADLAAIALNNTTIDQRLLHELNRYVARIAKISPTDTVNDIFLESVDLVEDVFKPSRYMFHYSDLEYFQQRRHLLKQFPMHFDRNPRALGTGNALADWAFQQGETQLFPDDFPSDLVKTHPISKNRSIFFAPVLRDNAIVGVVEIETPESAFDENRKMFLSTLILQASVAIKQIEQRERRAEAIKTRFNPYVVGAPIQHPDSFFGRVGILEKLMSGLHLNSFAILDERRLGKTSLLYRLDYELKYHHKDPNIHFLTTPILNLQGLEPEYFFASLANIIKVAIGDTEGNLADTSQYDYNKFRRELDKIKRKLPTKATIIVLFLDEIDSFNKYPDAYQQQFRNILVGEPWLRVVVAGVTIEKNAKNTSPWYNTLKEEQVGFFTEEEAFELITQPVIGKYTFSEQAIAEIIQKSELRPRNIQFYCSEALNEMFKRIKSLEPGQVPTILVEDIRAITTPPPDDKKQHVGHTSTGPRAPEPDQDIII